MNLVRPRFSWAVQGVGLTGQQPVKASGGDEGALERRDGFGHIIESDGIRFAGKGAAEGLRVAIEVPEPLNDLFRGPDGHFDWVEDRALGLFGQIVGASVPELGALKPGVNDRRGIPLPGDARGALGSGSKVRAGAALGEKMAIVTGLGLVEGDAALKVELLAQGNPLRGVGFAAGHGGGQATEVDAGAEEGDVPIHEVFMGMAGGGEGFLGSRTADRTRTGYGRQPENQTDAAGNEAVSHSRTS